MTGGPVPPEDVASTGVYWLALSWVRALIVVLGEGVFTRLLVLNPLYQRSAGLQVLKLDDL